jgi:hypothetical protein
MANTSLTETFSVHFNNFIQRKHPLLKLNLSNNILENNFIQKTKLNLSKMKIRELELEKCNFNDFGLPYLLDGLLKNSHLLTLSLRDNIFSPNIIENIKSFVQKNKILKILRLGSSMDNYSRITELTNKLIEFKKSIRDKEYSANIEF